MEDTIESKEYKVSGYENLTRDIEGEDDTSCMPINNSFNEETIEINYAKGDLSTSIESSDKYFDQVLGKKEVIINEKWDIIENIQGKVIHLDKEEVFVDCLIDIENRTFQHRTFPIYLFENIDGLTSNKTVIIKIRIKAGSSRIDIYPGDGIVNLDLFKQKENWESLEGSGLDNKLTKW